MSNTVPVAAPHEVADNSEEQGYSHLLNLDEFGGAPVR